MKTKYKSQLEVDTAKHLKENKIKARYEKKRLPYLWIEEKHYIPDFFLSNGVILECKGRFTLSDRKKMLFIKEQYPDMDIRFVFSNPKQKLWKKGKMTYGRWCEKNGYLYCKAAEGIPADWLQ